MRILLLFAGLLCLTTGQAQNGTGYFVRFPDDVFSDLCSPASAYGTPVVLADPATTAVVATYEDSVITVVPDACFKIFRTWTIIDWNHYDPLLPLTMVPNPTPGGPPGVPEDLTGPVVSSSDTLPVPWNASVVKIELTDPDPTNYAIFWSAMPNGYTYVQTIKVIDAKDPVWVNPQPNPRFQDITANDSTLWNSPEWLEYGTGNHDMREAPSPLFVEATDACAGSNIQFKCLLFLDLDGNGTTETVIRADTVTEPGVVYVNNFSLPNYSGGDPRFFDQRPIADSLKYSFALKYTIDTATLTKKAELVWVSTQTPGEYFVPQLPYGGHIIKWIVEDGCGNENVFERKVIVSDEFILQFYGNAYLDLNGDCNYDQAIETGLGGQVVTAVIYPSLQTANSVTEADGYYNLYLLPAPGDTSILLSVTGLGLPTLCPELIPIQPGENNLLRHLPIPLVGECPKLYVDIASISLRRCFPNIWQVKYYNLSPETALDAYMELDVDTFLSVTSASRPYTQTGNTYRFELGNIAGGEVRNFSVNTVVSCNAVPGQTHCITAHIYPDSLCSDTVQLWSGASIVTRAICDGDSVRLTIKNKGTGNMQDALQYIVIEDVIMYRSGNFQLNAGDSTEFAMAASGSTWRIEAEQEPGHPAENHPASHLEGCGGLTTPGLVNLFPQDDEQPYLETFCRQNIGSYDPNDKQAIPEGYGVSHFIRKNTEIEYMIRFQNTGTDTAFRVVVVDTLSSLLDWKTLKPGVSSHPYRLDVLPGGVLRFVFDPIALPDSNANQLGSNGFFQFRIAQQPDLSDGTVIKNTASIYFDFNAPVVTNTVFHTIGTNFITVEVDEPRRATDLSLRVAPNPFTDQTTITIQGPSLEKSQFRLIGNDGKIWMTQQVNGNSFVLQNPGLPPGIYYFQVISGAGIGTGKVVVR